MTPDELHMFLNYVDKALRDERSAPGGALP
jgi:hypothetical protein